MLRVIHGITYIKGGCAVPGIGTVRRNPNSTRCRQESKYLLHSLCEERISPGLTDDQICPLHNHNTDEEGSMAGELQDLTLIVSLQGAVKIDHQCDKVWVNVQRLRPSMQDYPSHHSTG